MKTDNDTLADALAALPSPVLPRSISERTLACARGNLAPPPGSEPRPLLRAIPAYAMPAALLSADAVFLADACIKMGRIFGT
jgi:hypothetical protein